MRALKPYQKQNILRQCAEAFSARRQELIQAVITEAGKPIQFAKAEVKRLISTFSLAADAVTTLNDGDVIPLAVTQAASDYRGMTQRVPIGVCGLISPFNFPLNLAAHKIAPAIAAGCPFILKPASATPLSALLIGDILSQTDLPQGAFSILPMSSKTADRLVTDEHVDLLSFTGSDVVGWDLKARAGKKKVVLELGGNAAVLIEPSADLERALPRIITGGYAYAGQVCISVQRVLAHQSIYEKIKAELMAQIQQIKTGNPNLPDTLIGPMISHTELKRAKQWLDEAVAAGATLVCGGQVDGNTMQPALLTNVPIDCHVYKDEVFAPIMLLESYDDLADGIKKANDSRFGLQVGIFTNDLNAAFEAWDQLETGGVVVNDVPTFRVDNMPYGGVKDSGCGREGIRYAIEDMSQIRLMVVSR